MNFQHFIGNLTDAPVLRSKEDAATPRTTFTLAVTDGRDSKGNDKVHFLNFTAFGTFAKNLLSVNKGTRMSIIARVDTYPKEVQIEGRDVSINITTFIAVDGGPSMLWATVKVERNDYKKPVTEAPKSNDEDDDDEVVVERPRRSSRNLGNDEEPRQRRSAREESGEEPRERRSSRR